MNRILVASTEERINKTIKSVNGQFAEQFEFHFLTDEGEIVEDLNYELPELTVINCSDPELNLRHVVGEMRRDPWLHSGALVLVHDPEKACVVPESLSELNLISVIETGRLGMYFPRLLRILHSHEKILYQRNLHSLLRANVSGSLVMENDPFDMTTYSNLLANFLYHAGLIGQEQKEKFYIALMELLINAIEHGNCRISYEEKTALLDEGKDPMDLIREKNRDPEVNRRRVYLTYRIRPHESSFTIRDEGDGFDWRAYQTATGRAGLEENHGRGILMASHYLSNLRYNDKGNEASFELEHPAGESTLIPEMFSDQEEIVFKDNEVVFKEGEKSSYLYYIVSGQFDIYVGNRRVSRLTPADIFVGEMSLLLGDKRSATVRSVGRGVLIKISKGEFIRAIKEKPYYGLLLARILSQRLVRLHQVDG